MHNHPKMQRGCAVALRGNTAVVVALVLGNSNPTIMFLVKG